MKPQEPNPDLLTRWIDGELGEADQAALNADFPEGSDARAELMAILQAEKASSDQLGAMLRQNFPAARDVAGPDLFMHQLAHRLDRATETAKTAPDAGTISPPPPGKRAPIWFAAMAAAIAVLLAARFILPDGNRAETAAAPPSPVPSVLLASYAPDESVRVDARYDAGVDAVIIVLDGLEPVETTGELVGFQANDPRPIQARLAGRIPPHRFRGGHGNGNS